MVQKEFYNQAQTSGIRKYYRVITDKPNYSVVTSDSAYTTHLPIQMLLQKCIGLIMGCVLKTSE